MTSVTMSVVDVVDVRSEFLSAITDLDHAAQEFRPQQKAAAYNRAIAAFDSLRNQLIARNESENGDFTLDVLEVLCRVFDDGADVAMEEWRAWYKPAEWLHPSRALGAFIGGRLRERSERAAPQETLQRIRSAIVARPKHLAIPVDVEDLNILLAAIDAAGAAP